MDNPFSLNRKTILVTGASSGIGRATAIWCSKLGATVFCVGRNVEALQATMSLLQGEGHQSVIADLSIEENLDKMVTDLPALDGVALCAGVAKMLPIAFVNKKELDSIFSVNFFAPILLAQKLVKAKKVNKPASIVFVSSVDGCKVSQMGNSMYASSKGALSSMSRNMALELAGKKIRVNCVLPGTTNTNMIRTAHITEEMLAERAKNYPLKRLGEADDIAYAIIYLLSDASAWVTGTDLVVDGGFTLQ